ncbi:MAG: DUF1697 domain-containing protein [Prolixibacteraceae bacterium]|nr:DUF1697 domain-containing protein [Prolixibacteraceae bacterium]
MEIYISILRGINVSGQKSIKMADLKTMYEKLNFSDVKTYVQSGNVVFRAGNEKTGILEQKIREKIKANFGFDVPVIVMSVDKLKTIIESNPLKDDPAKDEKFLHVTFLGSAPENYNEELILSKKAGQEEIVITSNAVYLYCPHGYGTSKLNNNFIENKLKVTATTRNWKTANELLKLANSV